MTDNPGNQGYPTSTGDKGPSPEFVWTRTERALSNSAEAMHKIAIHEGVRHALP